MNGKTTCLCRLSGAVIFLSVLTVRGAIYYVNDGATNGDVWCQSPGCITNSALVPESPMLSLAQVLEPKLPGLMIAMQGG
jgi:hypothetical protein